MRAPRSPGYVVATVVVAISSCLTLMMAFWRPPEVLGPMLTSFERAELVVATVLGAIAATVLWRRDRAAPEVFLAWAVVVLAVSTHLSITVTPRILRLAEDLLPGIGLPSALSPAAVWLNLLLNAVLLGLAYWQLARHRPPRTGHDG